MVYFTFVFLVLVWFLEIVPKQKLFNNLYNNIIVND